MVFVGVVTDTQWKIFCEAFGLADLLADPALKTNPQRVEARPRIIPIVTALFGKMTKPELHGEVRGARPAVRADHAGRRTCSTIRTSRRPAGSPTSR